MATKDGPTSLPALTGHRALPGPGGFLDPTVAMLRAFSLRRGAKFSYELCPTFF